MRFTNYLLLLALACLWGPSFLFIKIAVEQSTPLTIATIRIIIGVSILLAILKIRYGSVSKGELGWSHFLLTGFFNMALPYVLISWGEQYIDSALAGILNGLTPFCALVINHFWSKDEKLSLNKVGGTLLGFVGLCFLMFPYMNAGNMGSVFGIGLVAVAAASYGLASVYTKKKLVGLKPLVGPSYQLLSGLAFLMPAWLIFDKPSAIVSQSSSFWWSIAALGFFGTCLAYIVYFKIVERTHAVFVTYVTYLMPVISVILGVVFLDEEIFWNVYAGGGLILFGLAIANYQRKVVSAQVTR